MSGFAPDFRMAILSEERRDGGLFCKTPLRVGILGRPGVEGSIRALLWKVFREEKVELAKRIPICANCSAGFGDRLKRCFGSGEAEGERAYCDMLVLELSEDLEKDVAAVKEFAAVHMKRFGGIVSLVTGEVVQMRVFERMMEEEKRDGDRIVKIGSGWVDGMQWSFYKIGKAAAAAS